VGAVDPGRFTGLLAAAKTLVDELTATRRDIHRHPELGFREHRTAGIVANKLRELGLDPETGVAETGVVATLTGTRPGRTVLLRADMDALPIAEGTGLSLRRKRRG
jgi:metal-dependent amidase/aminoacylase/carboxypeptidase family protein